MLKIKRDVDLDILEKKYGFNLVNGSYRIISKRSVMPSERGFISKHYCLTIFKNRKIQISASGKDSAYEILFDLISDGLVEKVEE